MKNSESSAVVFENTKKEQFFYRVGETFSDGSKIISVNDNSIMVRLSDGSYLECFVTQGAAKYAGTGSFANTPASDKPAFIPPSLRGDQERQRTPVRKRSRAAHEDDETD